MNAAVTSFGHSALYILQMLECLRACIMSTLNVICYFVGVYRATVVYYVIVISVK